MTLRARFRAWFRDLFTPIGDRPVVLSPPRPIERVVLEQAIVAQVIGPHAPLVDKAAFIASPHIVQAAARWGAQRGAEVREAAIDDAIDVDGWSS